MDLHKSDGLKFVLLAALVSGFSIFVNKYAVSMNDAFAFTSLKNVSVALMLGALLLLSGGFSELKGLSRKTWAKLAAIGLIGGSIPFLLFFRGLQLTSAASASFVHKLMFVFVAVLAAVFLKEKILENKKFFAAALAIIAGNALLLQIPASLDEGVLLVFAAMVLWAIETVISKKVLSEVSARTVAFGRMFFGSIFLLAFLVATNRVETVFALNGEQIWWIALTSVLLLAYVETWYKGLQQASATSATIVLLLGAPVTSLLSIALDAKMLSMPQIAGTALLVAGVVVAVGSTNIVAALKAIPRAFAQKIPRL